MLIDEKISYREATGSTEQTIIFVHGNSLDSKYFTGLLDNHSLGQYRRISLDLPGHGDSTQLSHYKISDFVAAIEYLIHSLGLQEYWLVGHSLGGHIITQALARLSPQGVLLAATPPLSKPISAQAFLPFEFMPVCYQEKPIEKDLKQLFCALESPVQLLADFRATDPAVRSSLLEIITKQKFTDEVIALSNYDGKIAFVVGATDPIVCTTYVEALAQELGAQFHCLLGNHNFILSKEDEFAELLSNFITGTHHPTFFLSDKSTSYEY